MAEVPIMQEQLSADRYGWRKCRLCRSNYRPTAMDGGSADYAGAIIGPHILCIVAPAHPCARDIHYFL
jgi:hypothetical protein